MNNSPLYESIMQAIEQAEKEYRDIPETGEDMIPEVNQDYIDYFRVTARERMPI